MSSAASHPQQNEPPAYRERRRQDDMAGQQQQQTQQQQPTQDVVIDRLTDRLSAIFQPQLKDIKEQLANLITRREHEKDLAEVSADIAAQRRDFDRLQDWAEKRPRESADAAWVKRLEMDVQAISTRLAAQPAETRAWFNTAMSGGGCLNMLVMLVLMVFFQVVGIAVSVLIALALRGG